MQVSKWGNSLAVRLPAAVVEALGLKEGDQIEIHVAGRHAFEVSKAPGRRELLARLRKFRGRLPASFKFDRLEAQETMLRLLELAERSDGVRIFIGAESGLFGTSGVSMVVAPARNAANRIVGAIGVIGPTRINYGRIIPVVDYTARVIGRLLG